MAKASKPIEMTSKHLSKQEKEERRQAEQQLKGNTDLVYKAPKYLSTPEKKLYKFLVEELQGSGILLALFRLNPSRQFQNSLILLTVHQWVIFLISNLKMFLLASRKKQDLSVSQIPFLA